jgi:hypothetical protein
MNYWDQLPQGTPIYTLSESGFTNAARKTSGFPVSCGLAFDKATGSLFAYTQRKKAILKMCWSDEEPVIADTRNTIIDLGSAARPILKNPSKELEVQIQDALYRGRYSPAHVIRIVMH